MITHLTKLNVLVHLPVFKFIIVEVVVGVFIKNKGEKIIFDSLK